MLIYVIAYIFVTSEFLTAVGDESWSCVVNTQQSTRPKAPENLYIHPVFIFPEGVYNLINP